LSRRRAHGHQGCRRRGERFTRTRTVARAGRAGASVARAWPRQAQSGVPPTPLGRGRPPLQARMRAISRVLRKALWAPEARRRQPRPSSEPKGAAAVGEIGRCPSRSPRSFRRTRRRRTTCRAWLEPQPRARALTKRQQRALEGLYRGAML